ncbi:GntR family transcriptional regulator [Planctomicrobium sp. SH527]|uniref:GntR family transcriptional regulator n=1 Tax=Planctomicrobium sp. SH527 TaxID=3448123 RepID=UPI003F5AE5D9
MSHVTAATTPPNESSSSVRSNERCYQILRKMLICAQIPPGTRLGEVEWSERLKVQRAALREAMVLLVHDGLLMRRDSGGFFTPRLEEIDIEHVMNARAVLELGALKITCGRNLKDIHYQPVVDICRVQQQCHEAGMISGFCEADFLFHQKLLELSGNPVLIKMFSHSAQLIYVVTPQTDDVQRTSESQTIAEHLEILGHVREKRLSEAIDLLETHLMKAKKTMLSLLT